MQSPLSIPLSSPEETAALARRIGRFLVPGDCLLLSGPIGAGKSHFCRSLIQSVLTAPEDVPSPTFTLVQTYDCPAGTLWHADLYRLADVQEIEELGLLEAFETAICLVEWPDRLGADLPPGALSLTFETTASAADERQITLSWTAPDWTARLNAGLCDD